MLSQVKFFLIMEGVLKSFAHHLGWGLAGALSAAVASVAGCLIVGALNTKRRNPGPDGGGAQVFVFFLTALVAVTATVGGLSVGATESPKVLLGTSVFSLAAGGTLFALF